MPNPVLNQKTFQSERAYSVDDTAAGWAAPVSGGAPAQAEVRGATMTLNGTIAKTLVLLALLVAAGGYGWSIIDQAPNGDVSISGIGAILLPLSFFVALGLGFLTAFVPKAAPFTAPLYALAEGVLLGAISALLNARFDGIVVQAVAATVGVFLVMLVLYTSRAIRVTPKLQKTIIGATVGVLVAYLLMFIASFFTSSVEVFTSGPVGIVVSLIVAAVAAANLLLDFSFVEQGVATGAPKRYEWYCGFGIMVTVVWLYLSILRLIAASR